jgi:L-methionine (R)-S-oxide reductase
MVIPSAIESALKSRNATSVLRETLKHFGCEAGTVHWFEVHSGLLTLAASHHIPPHIAALVGTVPLGKGIAGLAAQRRAPVSMCNLQTDTSGDARPEAKSTGVEGSLAVPMITFGDLCGVLGIAKSCAHEWTDDEKRLLLAIAEQLGELRP